MKSAKDASATIAIKFAVGSQGRASSGHRTEMAAREKGRSKAESLRRAGSARKVRGMSTTDATHGPPTAAVLVRSPAENLAHAVSRAVPRDSAPQDLMAVKNEREFRALAAKKAPTTNRNHVDRHMAVNSMRGARSAAAETGPNRTRKNAAAGDVKATSNRIMSSTATPSLRQPTQIWRRDRSETAEMPARMRLPRAAQVRKASAAEAEVRVTTRRPTSRDRSKARFEAARKSAVMFVRRRI